MNSRTLNALPSGQTRLTCLPSYDGKLPDGQISKNLSSPSRKNISLNPSGKSLLEIRPSHPTRGGSRVVTNARWDAMDATASGAQWDRRVGFPVSDRPARGRTALLTVLARTRRAARGPARPLAWAGADGEVVWSWRPDAGVKSCGDASGPTGFCDVSSIRKATVANKPGHRGEHEVSRKPFAQGKPE
jgi:hypothetical protein